MTTGARGAICRRIVGDVEQAFLDVGFGHAADGVTHFLGDELGGVGVDDVVDLQHLPLLHQQADDVDRAFGHAVGEIGNRDRLGDRDFANELFLWLVRGLTLEPLRAAAERSDGTLAHFVGAQRGDQRQAAALFRRRATRRGGTRRGGASGAAGTARAWRFVVFGLERHAPGGLAGFILAKTLLGDFAGLALGFFVVLATIVFLALARLGGFALGAVAGFARGFAAGFLLGDLALFRLAHARVGKRMGACVTLLVRQRAQHHARWLRRLGDRRWSRGFRRGRCLARRLGGGLLDAGLSRPAHGAAFDLLDDDLFAAAMAKALAHHARLGARLERQLGDAQFLLARVLRITHSAFYPRAPSVGAMALTSSGEFPGPKAL